MTRTVLLTALCLSGGGIASAQCCPNAVGVPPMSTLPQAAAPAPAGFGLLGKLNQPFIPGLPAVPGLPTVSPLGLVAPRLSYLTTFSTTGGFGNMPANLPNLIGFATPRGASVIGLFQGDTRNTGQWVNSGIGILSPRLATGVRLLQAARQMRPAGGAQGCCCR